MTRRELLALTCGWTASAGYALGQHPGDRAIRPVATPPETGDADITLRISEIALELAPRRTVRTLAYNGQVPGPLLRAPLGKPIAVDVWNDTHDEDIVHWHGFHIAPEVDGSLEEGTPGVPPHARRRYTFSPNPAGTQWYHSHIMAGRNLKRGGYTGQFGMFIVEGASDPGNYDREVPLLIHEWDPHFTTEGPLDVEFRYFSINGKMLGAGEPLRVRSGERVLFRIVNASATLTHRLALPGHMFYVTSLDGTPVSNPARVSMLELAPGERVDAVVEMTSPGVWVLGELRTARRTAGMGIVVEYAGHQGPPRWQPPESIVWSYARFGGRTAVVEPDGRLTLVFKSTDDGHHWTINGKSYPRTDPIEVRANKRYRWVFDNQSANDHPVHLHRHRFEIVRLGDQPMSGVWKDVVMVPAWKQVEVDVPTTQPGLTLFHCHQQFHMDMGFMALMKYVG
jgi:FtsP/CotA-like multicopper oxidase with cupredoxin domain